MICLTSDKIRFINPVSSTIDVYKRKIQSKPVHAVTSVKQSPVLKGHIFFVL
jgi:hypothetical protein